MQTGVGPSYLLDKALRALEADSCLLTPWPFCLWQERREQTLHAQRTLYCQQHRVKGKNSKWVIESLGHWVIESKEWMLFPLPKYFSTQPWYIALADRRIDGLVKSQKYPLSLNGRGLG